MTITSIIPQRPPFLFVDQVVTLAAGERATTTKLVTVDEWFFQQPANPTVTVPMFVMIEMMAQTGAAALLADHPGNNALFGGIRQAEQLKPVHPGDQLTCQVTLDKLRGTVGIGSGETTVNGQVVFRATLLFVMVPEEGPNDVSKSARC